MVERLWNGWRAAYVTSGGAAGGVKPDDVEAGWSWYLDRLGAALHDAPMPTWTDYAPRQEES